MKFGAWYKEHTIRFCFATPSLEETVLVLTDDTGETIRRIPSGEGEAEGSVVSFQIRVDDPRTIGYYYEVQGQPMSDPYAACIRNKISFPVEEKNDKDTFSFAMTPDQVLYKLHVRGFTMLDDQLSEDERGTFQGLIQKIPYLSDLGVTGIVLMPVYTFPTYLRDGRINYWGFSDQNRYFSPNERYAGSKRPDVAFNDMVRAMHRAGIAVFMELYFPEQEDPFLAIRVQRFYTRYYHIDGFVLRGDAECLKRSLHDPYLSSCVRIVEEYQYGFIQESPYCHALRTGVLHTSFMTAAREFLRGTNGATPSFLSYSMRSPEDVTMINYVTDHNGFTLRDLVTYAYKHNESNGWSGDDGGTDEHSANYGVEGPTRKKKVNAVRKQQIQNAFLYMMFSAGVPMILSGDEAGRTQKGNNNGYLLDNRDGYFDWALARKDPSLFEYVQMLIRLRKEIGSILFRDTKENETKHSNFPKHSVHGSKPYRMENVKPFGGVCYFNGEDALYIGCNACAEEVELGLPELPNGKKWKILFTASENHPIIEESKSLERLHTITLQERSCMVLYTKSL